MKRLLLACRYSWDGLRAAFRDEAAFRQELGLAVVLFPLALYLSRTALECVALCGSVLLLLIVELVNTAVEAAVDRAGPERHPESKKAKDVGSAAVLLALLNMAMVWGVILL
jgi:diacylglycerol kinase (ATP)